jgi:serine/threonine protein kinase
VADAGEVFAGRFELLEPIGAGGMGEVWVVRDQREGRVVAAKLLRQQDAVSLLRFVREQATRIHHPHVVTPLSWAGADDRVLFTMPLLRGGSVATLVGDFGPLPDQWVGVLLAQTLAALGAVHGAGVVHRDVKPGNLLLEATGSGVPHLRLSDFGVAVSRDQPRLTRAFTVVGTPGYLAPEQEQGAEPDPVQDLYAAGVTGLHLLTGTPPPHDLAVLPATPLADLLTRATDPDPSRRPASAGEFATALRAAMPERPWHPGDVEVLEHVRAPDPPTAPVAGRPPTAPTPTRERRTTPAGGGPDRAGWPVVALLVAGLALLALGAWLLV